MIRDSAQGTARARTGQKRRRQPATQRHGQLQRRTTIDGGTLQLTGSSFPSPVINIGPAGTLYFNRTAGYLGYANPISGSGLLQINQGSHSLHLGTGHNTMLGGFAGQ